MVASAANETLGAPLDQTGHGLNSFRVLKEKKFLL
jgi:hypothetical protein